MPRSFLNLSMKADVEFMSYVLIKMKNVVWFLNQFGFTVLMGTMIEPVPHPLVCVWLSIA